MADQPLQVVGVEIVDGKAVRGAFDAAWTAADQAETLQRLDGLTKALPVAAIVADPTVDYAALLAAVTRLELAALGVAGSGDPIGRIEAIADALTRLFSESVP